MVHTVAFMYESPVTSVHSRGDTGQHWCCERICQGFASIASDITPGNFTNMSITGFGYCNNFVLRGQRSIRVRSQVFAVSATVSYLPIARYPWFTVFWFSKAYLHSAMYWYQPDKDTGFFWQYIFINPDNIF